MIGGNEIVILIIVALLILGVKNAPQIGASLGKSIKSFKRATEGIDEIDVTPSESREHRIEQGGSEDWNED